MSGYAKRCEVALLAELDALSVADHPDAVADPLIRSRLSGTVELLCTPAEEYIDFAFRNRLREEGKIEFFSGKQELVRLGYFDDVDLCMMFHSLDLGDDAVMNIHAQRETFRDEDHARVHSIITKGGDVVNVVPSEVCMDAYVRAASVEAMQDANAKVDRALQAGAAAVGAHVQIVDRAGYLPIRDYPDFHALFGRNVGKLGYGERIVAGEQFSGSFDFGDISYLKPAIHPMVGGVSGALHASDFRLTDIDRAVVLPAKAMAMTVIDLLCDGAREAKQLIDSYPPAMSKEQYLSYLRSFSD